MNKGVYNVLHYIRFLFLIIVFCQSYMLSAQNDFTENDVSPSLPLTDKKIEFRIPSEKKIEKYQKDKRFHYEQPNITKSTWLYKLKYWFLDKIASLLENVIKTGSATIIIAIALVVLFVCLILKISGVKFRALLGKKKLDTPEVKLYGVEEIHTKFDDLIENAMAKRDYRLAIRYIYLKNLKLLSEKEYIKWSPNKTNYSYQYEIADLQLRNMFIENTFIFDYIWYGEFPLDETYFAGIYSQMDKFSKTITNEKK